MTRHRDQEGQAAPLLLVAMVALALTAMALVQGGRIGLLSAEAATGADAAALAAAGQLADDLEGPPGIVYLLTRSIPADARGAAEGVGRDYADRNDTELRGLSIATPERLRVVVEADTRTDAQLGRPATTDEIRDFRADGVAAAEIELTLIGATGRGCMSMAEVRAIAASIGVTPVSPSGLSGCGGSDTNNLRPDMKQELVRLEAEMGTRLVIASGFRTLEEQLRLYEELNPIGAAVAYPGTSYHEVGLAVDVGNHQAAKAAIDANSAIRLCQPLPDNDAVHFSHADYGECGGPYGRPAGPESIKAADPILVDPATN